MLLLKPESQFLNFLAFSTEGNIYAYYAILVENDGLTVSDFLDSDCLKPTIRETIESHLDLLTKDHQLSDFSKIVNLTQDEIDNYDTISHLQQFLMIA